MYYIFILALETAMRQGEILGLRWENMDLRKVLHFYQRLKMEVKDMFLYQKKLG
ncbi:site-specific integrase [Enterobacter cloacae]|uniref:hypothetical protein n=1 Tax=Enterobacter cloacae TaxID=550 RepID=UPI003890A25B